MLRCLGVKVKYASLIFGDNIGVIQNNTILDSLLRNKHVAIIYHRIREVATAGILTHSKSQEKTTFSILWQIQLLGLHFVDWMGD